MLRKFRRSSRDPNPVVVAAEPLATPQCREDSGYVHKQITFLDLPGEIRNSIYQAVAQDTVLTLKPSSKRNKLSRKNSYSIPGLLLASRQCRHEALPVLLSISPLDVRVDNFNFKPLMRVISSLYSAELKALRENSQLVVRLAFNDTRSVRQEVMTDLRRWLVRRAEGLDRLPWQYTLESGAPKEQSSLDAAARLGWMWRLSAMSEETLGWELLGIIHVFRETIGKAVSRMNADERVQWSVSRGE